MKVYIVFWKNSVGAWDVVKLFSTEEKTKDFLKDKSNEFWYEEQEVE